MISLILIILAGFFNACMDVLKTRFDKSIFRNWPNQNWVDPSISFPITWPNKWKDGDPSSGEKFPGSSTFLVWITDFWHLCKMLMLLCIMFSIVFYNPLVNWWADILILYCSFTITFELFFSKILIKKS